METRSMQSFFGRLQSYFSSTFEGRYFSLILAEAMAREPAIIRGVFPHIRPELVEAVRKGQASIVTEYPVGGRYADLAIISSAREVIAIAEVKQSDIISPGVVNQLKAYRKWVKESGYPISFSLVTMHHPDDEHLRVIRGSWGVGKACVVRFHHIAHHLGKLRDRPVVQLFLDFMKEQRMTGYQHLEKETSTLTLLMTRFLPVQHSHGFGRLQSTRSVRSVAEMFDTLLRNTQFMADWFRAGNTDLFPRTFASEFRTRPWFELDRLAHYLQSNRERKAYELPRNQCTGGALDVHVQGHLSAKSVSAPKGHKVSFYFGYWIELDVAANTLKPHLYFTVAAGSAFAQHSLHECWTRCQLSWKEETVRLRLKRLARDAIHSASKDAISPRIKKALNHISFTGY